MSIACIATDERIVDPITVRALTSLACPIELNSIWRCAPEGCWLATAVADSTFLVDSATIRAAVIDCASAHQVIRSVGFIFGGRCMTVFTLVCRAMIVIGITVALPNRVVTTFATYLPCATVAADTLCIMLVQHISISWTHLVLARITIESNIARAPLFL